MLTPLRAGVFARPGIFTDIGACLVCAALAGLIAISAVRGYSAGVIRVCLPTETAR